MGLRTVDGKFKNNRSVYFDNLRAILIVLVLVGHFGGDNTSFDPDGNMFLQSVECFIYLIHMPLLFFISGMFSKNTEKCRERAFFDLLNPYLLFQVFYGIVQYVMNSSSVYLRDPFWPAPALWYLFALFLYRFLLHDIVKIRWNLALAGLLAVFGFLFTGLSHEFAMNRVVPYFVFFLAGYHISPQKVVSIRSSLLCRKGMLTLLLLFLTGFACVVFAAIYFVLDHKMISFSGLLGLIGHSRSYLDVGIGWNTALLFSVASLCTTVLLSITLLLITPEKRCCLSGIGSDTLPLYLSHMLVQVLYYWVQRRWFFFDSWTANYLLSFVPVVLCVIVFSSNRYRKCFHICLERIRSFLKMERLL